jgi:hypothetical protein
LDILCEFACEPFYENSSSAHLALGAAIRRLLGPRLARRVGRRYRSFFVDLDKEAAALSEAIPRDVHLLDIGGGDGEPLNHLLNLRPDLRVTTIDPGPVVGNWISDRFDQQVKRMPRTNLAEYLDGGNANPDAILIADVMHHIPKTGRGHFLGSVATLLQRVPHLRIIVKDVEPGSWRALLGYWADLYITGDLDVNPISRQDLTQLFREALGPLRSEDTNLFEADHPNYAVTFFR